MDRQLALLLNLIEDEFRGHSQVRVRPLLPSGTRRSPDLEQDYDPEANSLHERSGVRVQLRGREWFFPTSCINESPRASLYRQIAEIREALGLTD